MANFTTNYNLKKPLGTENYNVEDQNGNMDIIDGKLKEHETHLADIKTDIQARKEIMDIKLKLEEQQAIDFVNKTGIGFYDNFADNSNIDIANTTAAYDSANKLVNFTGEQTLKLKNETFDKFNNMELALYPSKINKATVKGNVTNSNTVITGVTDKTLSTGDKLFMNNALNQVLGCTGDFSANTITDATIVEYTYEISGNGGRKLIKLDDGTLISAMRSGTVSYALFKSVDNGVTWVPLRTIAPSNVAGDIAITTDGIHLFAVLTNSVSIQAYTINLTDGSTLSTANIDVSQTAFGGVSAIVNPQNTEIHVCYPSKNASYPNCLNIKYVKGIINADGSVSWGVATQVTSKNTSGTDYFNPSIIVDANNNPVILVNSNTSSTSSIQSYTYNGNGTWTYHDIYVSSIGYPQSNPSAIFVPQLVNGLAQGRIWVAWTGKDTIDTGCYNVRVAYSDDGGATWTMRKLTSGNAIDYVQPSITANTKNEVFVVYKQSSVSAQIIYKVKCADDIWGTPQISKTGTSPSFPSTAYDIKCDFIEPLYIYKEATKIGFSGSWIVGEGYTLTMQDPVTLTDGEKIPIIDMKAQQNNTDMTFKTVDSEKFTYASNNLNTSIADIKVLGTNNKLNTIAYSIG